MNSRLINRLSALATAFSAGNLHDLKRIANDSISEAVMENDDGAAKLSVVAYSLYKLLSKEHITENKRWGTVGKIIKVALGKSMEALQNGKNEQFNKNIETVIREIKAIDSEFGNFVESIFDKGTVKMASTAYALGVSIGKSAELTGADAKEVQMYIGTTKIHDEQTVKKSISKRLTELEELLAE